MVMKRDKSIQEPVEMEHSDWLEDNLWSRVALR